MERTTKIFLSHATEDADFAHRVAHDLKRAGFGVWIAPESILAGENWVDAINRGLQECQSVVLLLTPAAVQSPWVYQEMSTAIILERDRRLRILPVLAEHCPETDIPPLWRAYQRVEAPTYELLFKRLLGALTGKWVGETPDDMVMLNDLRQALISLDGEEALRELLQRYPAERTWDVLSEWVQDVTRPALARGRAFRWMLQIQPVSTEILTRLVRDPSMEFLREMLNAVTSQEKCHAVFSEEQARQLLTNPRLPRTSSGASQAIQACIRCGAPYTSAVYLTANMHPSWEVKYGCVRRIIEIDDGDAMRALQGFSTMSYWRARSRIVDYIHQRCEQGRLQGEDYRLAVEMLQQFVTDGELGEKTPTARKARELLALLHAMESKVTAPEQYVG